MLGLPAEFSADFLSRLEHLRLKTRRELQGMGKGSHLSPRRGSSLEFAGFGHYSDGDDLRYVDWNLFARTDRLYVKLFKEEEDLLTQLFVDASASMACPQADRKFDFARAAALALAYVALASGDRVMVRVLGGTALPASPGMVKGRHRIADLAAYLSAVRPAGGLDLPAALARELALVRRAGKVFLVSDFLMAPRALTDGLRLLTGANVDATAVQVLGGLELESADLSGEVEVRDVETGERAVVTLGTQERGALQRALARFSRELKAFCLRHGLRYALYVTSEPFTTFFMRAVTDLGLAH
jgi:uncharacterized protein (DUF58 family)